MSKKIEKKAWKLLVEEEQEVKKEADNFYDEEGLVDISTQPPISRVVADIQKTADNQTLTIEQAQDKCLQIRENVMAGKSNNIEVDLIHGTHKFEGNELPLGDTVFKAVEYSSHTPIYFYHKKEDANNVLVFIGGDDAQAFLATQDNEGNASFIRLAEFHLLSISENSKPEKEFGLMTSYNYLTAKIFSSIIFAFCLDPVKNLLLGEAIYAKAAKDAETSGLEEGDTDEQED